MESQVTPQTSNTEAKLDFKEAKYATGRRKTSIAKVWLKKGSGSFYVNGKKMIEYFKKENLQTAICRPFVVVKRSNEFDVKCLCKRRWIIRTSRCNNTWYSKSSSII